MSLENGAEKQTVRIEALKIAASLFADMLRPDAEEIVAMAKVFDDFVRDTGNATPQITKSRTPKKSQAPSES